MSAHEEGGAADELLKEIEDRTQAEGRARYSTAIERAATIAEGRQPHHPADRLKDPPGDTLARQHERAKTAEPRLKHLGGSTDDAFNLALAEATRQTAWITDTADNERALKFVGKALAGIAPQNEMEAMLAAQMVACHQASMECHRRAMLTNQTPEGRSMNLKAGARASQSYAALMATLGKHRNGGRQKVTVEHVHIAAGANAVIGNVQAGGRGDEHFSKGPHDQSAQAALAYAPGASLPCQDPSRHVVPIARDEGAATLPASRRRRAAR